MKVIVMIVIVILMTMTIMCGNSNINEIMWKWWKY